MYDLKLGISKTGLIEITYYTIAQLIYVAMTV